MQSAGDSAGGGGGDEEDGDGDGVGDGGSRDHDDNNNDGEEEEAEEQEEVEVEPAPAPRGGFVHASAVGVGHLLELGARVQYRLDDGWRVCKISKVIPGSSGICYDLHCEDEKVYMGLWLRSCEYGVRKRWVLWQNDHSIAGVSTYAAATVGTNERIMTAPRAGSDMDAYASERLNNNKAEYVYYNLQLALAVRLASWSSHTDNEATEGLRESQVGQVPIVPTWRIGQRPSQPSPIRRARSLFFYRTSARRRRTASQPVGNK